MYDGYGNFPASAHASSPAEAAFLVLAELGHSQIQNRPLIWNERSPSGFTYRMPNAQLGIFGMAASVLPRAEAVLSVPHANSSAPAGVNFT